MKVDRVFLSCLVLACAHTCQVLVGARPGKICYRVTAVDRMGNEGPASHAATADLGEIPSYTVKIEAEACGIQAPFQRKDDKNASRGAYAECPVTAPEGGSLVAEFDAPAGTYFVWARLAQVQIRGGSFDVRIDGEVTRFASLLLWKLHGGSNVRRYVAHWEWRCVSERGPRAALKRFRLKHGPHRLVISNVAPGTVIDEFVITADLTRQPADRTGQGWR